MITGTVVPLLDRLRRVTLVRYALASVAALAVDMGMFLGLLRIGVPATPASAAGYAVGIAVHWLASSRVVFNGHLADAGLARTRQQVLFVASALVGLVLTTGVVGVLSGLGLDPRLAKVAAIIASFAVTWLLRQRIVFR
jgi:putative flippase GtrA